MQEFLTGADLACPACGQLDQVQKVSVLVEAGTRTTSLSIPTSNVGLGLDGEWVLVPGWTTVSSPSRSALSEQLSLPVPYYRSPWRDSPSMGSVLLVELALAGFVFFLGLLIAPRSFWLFCTLGWLSLVVFAVVVALRKAQEAGFRRRRVASALPAWRRARHLWRQLYFCGRCDGVFLPGGHSGLILAEATREFCLQNC